MNSNNMTELFRPSKTIKNFIFTELWERFSYYGIRPLLVLYMIAMVNDGGLGLDRPTAAAIVGLFAGSMYLMTVLVAGLPITG